MRRPVCSAIVCAGLAAGISLLLLTHGTTETANAAPNVAGKQASEVFVEAIRQHLPHLSAEPKDAVRRALDRWLTTEVLVLGED